MVVSGASAAPLKASSDKLGFINAAPSNIPTNSFTLNLRAAVKPIITGINWNTESPILSNITNVPEPRSNAPKKTRNAVSPRIIPPAAKIARNGWKQPDIPSISISNGLIFSVETASSKVRFPAFITSSNTTGT